MVLVVPFSEICHRAYAWRSVVILIVVCNRARLAPASAVVETMEMETTEMETMAASIVLLVASMAVVWLRESAI
jgi:hypothetical protein